MHSPQKLTAAIVFLMSKVLLHAATTYFVATNGLDTNTGTSNAPFATITRAQTAASSGSIVYLRGGTYLLDNSHLTTNFNPWAIVNYITKSGVSYLAYPGERPVFDFSGVVPPTNRVTAFLVTASDCVFKGFDVVGVQVTITNGTPGVKNTQSECFRIDGGNRNLFEQLAMHDGMGIGWYLTRGQSNLVLNCDAYNNRGLDGLSIGNVDGFGIHGNNSNYTGNVLRGCRAWFNSDDGFDLINCQAPATIENCWAFYNGYFTNFASSGGDANGFKSGGYGVSSNTYTIPVPRHVTKFCLAVRNRANGFYANHHTGGLDWFNNTAHSNNVNFNMLCNLDASSTNNDVPGFDHVMKNNLGYKARSGTEVANLGASNDVTFNYFTLPATVANNDFATLNEALLTLPRQTNGDLPYIAFLQMVATNELVNAGTNIGHAYTGSAPDLGAFEYGSEPPPTLTLSNVGTNLIFTGSGGWAGGPLLLIGATNVNTPPSQWSLVATNVFDLAGSYVVTNPITPTIPQRFYRTKLP
jgi:pectate lyase